MVPDASAIDTRSPNSWLAGEEPKPRRITLNGVSMSAEPLFFADADQGVVLRYQRSPAGGLLMHRTQRRPLERITYGDVEIDW